MMPGITNLPARLIFSAPAGIRICDAGPTQPIRPLSTIIETCIAGGRPVPSIRVKSSSTLTSPKSEPADHKSRTRASIPPQLYINNMHASVAPGHALRKAFDSEWAACQAARRFLTGAPNYLYDSLIWLLPVRRFTANFGRGGIPRAESYAFFDHVNHVFCITGIQEKHV